MEKRDQGLSDSGISYGVAPHDTYIDSGHTKVFTQLATAVGIDTGMGFQVLTFNPSAKQGHRTDLPTDAGYAEKPETAIVVQGTVAGKQASASASVSEASVTSVMGREYAEEHAQLPVASPVAIRLLTSLTDAAIGAKGHEAKLNKTDWGHERRTVFIKHKGEISQNGKLLDEDVKEYMRENSAQLAQAERALVVASALQHEMGPVAKLAVDRDDMKRLKVYSFGSPRDEAAFSSAMSDAGIVTERLNESGQTGFIIEIPADPTQLIKAAGEAISSEKPGKPKPQGPRVDDVNSMIVGDTRDQLRNPEGQKGWLDAAKRRLGLGGGGRERGRREQGDLD